MSHYGLNRCTKDVPSAYLLACSFVILLVRSALWVPEAISVGTRQVPDGVGVRRMSRVGERAGGRAGVRTAVSDLITCTNVCGKPTYVSNRKEACAGVCSSVRSFLYSPRQKKRAEKNIRNSSRSWLVLPRFFFRNHIWILIMYDRSFKRVSYLCLFDCLHVTGGPLSRCR